MGNLTSTPGKVAPITAGEIIADTILNIIAEHSADCDCPETAPAV
jgi:hypothetical protein